MLDTAIEEANTALELDPDLPEAHLALTRACRYKGWYNKAQQAIDRALELYPDDDLALIEAGWISWFQGRVDEAYRYFIKALKLSPRLSRGLVAVGYVYNALHEYEKAKKWIENALEIQGDDLYALDALCVVFIQEDRLDALKESAERLTELAPGIVYGWWCALLSFRLQFGYNSIMENESQLEPDPVIEAFKTHIDRTLIRKNLKLMVEERLLQLAKLQEFADELRRAGAEARKRP